MVLMLGFVGLSGLDWVVTIVFKWWMGGYGVVGGDEFV